MTDCIFCKIINREVSSKIVYEDDKVLVFETIHPQADTHLLLIPKRHLESIGKANDQDGELLGYIQLVAAKIARDLKLESYRVHTNSGAPLQSVFHLHYHLLGGKIFGNEL